MPNDPDDIGIDASLKRLLRAIRENRPLRPIRADNETLMDADVMASHIAASFHAQGYKTRLKMVRDPNVEVFHHVFVEVWEPLTQTWIPIDPQRVEPREWGDEKIVDV